MYLHLCVVVRDCVVGACCRVGCHCAGWVRPGLCPCRRVSAPSSGFLRLLCVCYQASACLCGFGVSIGVSARCVSEHPCSSVCPCVCRDAHHAGYKASTRGDSDAAAAVAADNDVYARAAVIGGPRAGEVLNSDSEDANDVEPGSVLCEQCRRRMGSVAVGVRPFLAVVRDKTVEVHALATGTCTDVMPGNFDVARELALHGRAMEEAMTVPKLPFALGGQRDVSSVLPGHSRAITCVVVGAHAIFTGNRCL